MLYLFSRNSRHLKKCLMDKANNMLRIYSNQSLYNQCKIFPWNNHREVTRRLPVTIFPFTLKGHKISYQYSDPIKLYKEQNQGGKIEQQATILVVDLGATGLDCMKYDITEIAIRDVKGGENSAFHTLVNPESPLNNHKRNQILTQSSVPKLKEAILLLINWVKSRQTGSKPVILVAHNGDRFDFPFLVRAFHQTGHQIPENWLFLDSLPIARQLHHPDGTKLAKGSHKLINLVTFFGIIVEASAPKAMVDVNALSFVLQKMMYDLKLTVTDLIKRAFTSSRYSVGPQDK